MIINRLFTYRYYKLSFIIIDQIQILQRRYNVLFFNARHFTYFTETIVIR